MQYYDYFTQSMWKQYASECVKPAVEYFKVKFETELQHVLSAFKMRGSSIIWKWMICTLLLQMLTPCSPSNFLTKQLINSNVNYLLTWSLQMVDLLEWWGYHSIALPHWANAYKRWSSACPLQQLLSEYFPFSKMPLFHSRSLPYKIILKKP